MRNPRWMLLLVVACLGWGMATFAQEKNGTRQQEKATDPVCELKVVKDPQLSAEYKGKTFYFCSNADRAQFKKNPEKYANKKITPHDGARLIHIGPAWNAVRAQQSLRSRHDSR